MDGRSTMDWRRRLGKETQYGCPSCGMSFPFPFLMNVWRWRRTFQLKTAKRLACLAPHGMTSSTFHSVLSIHLRYTHSSFIRRTGIRAVHLQISSQTKRYELLPVLLPFSPKLHLSKSVWRGEGRSRALIMRKRVSWKIPTR